MIIFLKDWSNQIIVATIIAIILEMILPEGNNKKYIKMIIGIYVLFTIINPIISKVTGNSLEISNIDYSKYFDDSVSVYSNTEEFELDNSKLIIKSYIDNIENDIKTKIRQKGYKATNCKIDIIEDDNSEKYGTITNITLQVERVEDENESTENSNSIRIESVEININSTQNEQEIDTKENTLQDKEIEIIKEYLSNEYSVEKKIININKWERRKNVKGKNQSVF